MAVFEFVTPDGRRFEINAPDPAAAQRTFRAITGGPNAPNAGPVDLTRAGNQPPATPSEGVFRDTMYGLTGRDGVAMVGGQRYSAPYAPIGGPPTTPTDDYTGPPVPQVPRADPRSEEERAFELGLQGAGAGIADVVGAPVDLANAFLNLIYSGVNRVAGREVIPLQATPFGGSQSIRDAATPIAEGVGLEVLDREELTNPEALRYDISRYGTGAAIGAGGMARGASVLRPGGAAAPPSTPRLVDALTAPYAGAPGRAFTGDVAAGVGAGTANYGYEQFAPEALQESAYGPLANMLANIFGGVGGATTLAAAETAGRGVVGGVATAVRGSTDPSAPVSQIDGRPFRRQDLADAAAVVQDRASGWGRNDYDSMLAAAEIEAMQNQLGQFASPASLPTTGAASGNPGLIALEQRMRSQMPADFVRRDNATRQAAVGAAEQIAPSAATGRQFTNAVGEMDANRVAAARTEVDDVQEQIRQAEIAGRETAAPLDVRSPLRAQETAALAIDDTVVNQTLRPMQDASAKMFADIDPDRSAIVDVSGVVDVARLVRDNVGQLSDPAGVIPSGLLSRLDAVGEEGAQTAVGDIVAVWPEISRAIDRARQSQQFLLADNLQALRDGLNNAIDAAAAEGNEAAQRAVAARQNFADTLGSTFGRDQPVSQQLRRDFNLNRGGRSETPPSATAGQYLRTGQPERATELQNILARSKDPAAGQQAVQDYLMADLAATGVLDRSGYLRPDAMRRWLDKWGRAIDIASPDTRALVDELMVQAEAGQAVRGEMASELRAAAAHLSDVEKNKGAFAFVLGNNPSNAVNAIFQGGDPEMAVRQILDQIGTNQAAMDGFKASIREYMTERMTTSAVGATTDGSNPLAFGKLDTLFKRHEETLALIFSPEEMNALQASRAFLRPLNNLRQQATPGSRTTEGATQQFWNLLEVGLKARYGILKGGGLLRTIRLWAKTLPNNDSAVNQIMTQMMFDPDLAKHLLRMPRSQVDTPRFNRRLNQLLGVAEGSREDQERRKLASPVGN